MIEIEMAVSVSSAVSSQTCIIAQKLVVTESTDYSRDEIDAR